MSDNRCQVSDVRYQLKTVLYRLSSVVRFVAGIRYLISVICLAVSCQIKTVICHLLSVICFTAAICYLLSAICLARAPINLNTVTAEELTSFGGMSAEKIRALISYRKTSGGFTTLCEVEKIIGRAEFAYLQQFFTLYTVPKNVWETRLASSLSDLHIEQLTIKTFPLNEPIIYLTFPDGGNMLVNIPTAKDAKQFSALLTNEITRQAPQYRTMKVFGWKPRIDWLAITSPTLYHLASLEKICEQFDIKEIITPPELQLDIPRGIVHRILVAGQELDLRQVISPVKLIALAPKTGTTGVLALQLSYRDFSCLIAPSLDKAGQERCLRDYSVASTLLIYPQGLTQKFIAKVAPRFLIQSFGGSNFITDGYLYFILGEVEISKEKEVVSTPPEKPEVASRDDFAKAKEYYQSEKYNLAITQLEKILTADPTRIEAIELLEKAKAQLEAEKPKAKKVTRYYVRKGETLKDIARAVYGDPARWEEIYAANKEKLTDKNPQPGQILLIP